MSDWEPLADRDPVPGDPNAVMALSQRLGTTAVSIRKQTQQLSGLHSDEIWSGTAADQFRMYQQELPLVLSQLATRYEKVSEALRGYAPGLGEAQTMARTALQRAREAQGDIRSAQAGVEQIEQHNQQAQRAANEWNDAYPEGPLRHPDPWWGPNWSGQLAEAEANLVAAQRLLEDAREVRDRAARKCADAIDVAVHDELENGISLWDKNEVSPWDTIKKAVDIVEDALFGAEQGLIRRIRPGAPIPLPPPPPTVNVDDRRESESTFATETPIPYVDEKFRDLARVAAGAAKLRFPLASRFFLHFLDASGTPVKLDVDDLMDSDEETRKAMEASLREDVGALVKSRIPPGQPPMSFPFRTPPNGDWHSLNPSNMDWKLAIGATNYAFSGNVYVDPPLKPGGPNIVRVEYQTHMHDYYNWDKGDKLPGGVIDEEVLGRLHKTGLARGFEMSGSSRTITTGWTN